MGLLDSVGEAVKKVFKGSDRRLQTRERAARDLEAADFSVLTVDELLALGRDQFGNMLHVVSLRRFRARIGEEAWQHYADKVAHHSEDILFQNVSGRGTAAWQAPDTLVLTFPRLDEATGAGIARDVVVQLMKKLIGERFVEGEEQPIDLISVKTDAVLTPGGTIGFELLDGAIENELEVLTSNDPDAQDAAQTRRNAKALEMRRLRREKAEDGEWLPLEWPPTGVRHGRKLIVPKLTPQGAPGETVGLGYAPVMNVERGLVDRYRVVAIEAATGRPIEAGEDRRRTTLDLATLFHALEELEARLESSDQRLWLPALIVPLDYATAQGDARVTLGSVLRYFPDAVRSRYLSVELSGPDPHTSHTALRDTHNLVGSLCRDVMWRIGPGAKALVKPLAALAAYVGCETAEWSAAKPESAATLMANLAKAARPSRTFCWGVTDPRLVEVARNQKCALISGTVVGEMLASPPREAPDVFTAMSA